MIIDGKKIAEKILNELRQEVSSKKLELRLAAVLVGGNPGLLKFVELKEKAARQIGVDFRLYEFPENISNAKLREELNVIVKAKVNSGVLIELPLPKHLSSQPLLNVIPEEKDVDVLSQKAQGAFFAGRSKVLPPSVEAVRMILDTATNDPPSLEASGGRGKRQATSDKRQGYELKGKNIAVFGYGLLVGKPIAHWLMQQGATVSVINEFTKDSETLSRNADIIVSGVGKPKLITAQMVKDGAVVIDLGYENEAGKVVGDVDFEPVSKKVSFITPVPGGVGPIVIAAVLKNLVTLSLSS